MNLSPLELEVLEYIVAADEASAPSIHEQISAKRNTAYSTIKTVFDRLEEKGAIYRNAKVGRTNLYRAKVTTQVVQKTLFSEFVDRVFSRDKMALMSTLVREGDLSTEEIDYLQTLINERKQQS